MLPAELDAIALCQSGELSHFTILYDAYVQKIYAFLYFRTLHKETAEDLTSQVFLKAMTGIKSFDADRGSFSTWIYRIARNCLLDHYRTTVPMISLEDIYDKADAERIDKKVETEWKIEEVRAYLSKLPPEQSEIVILKIWDQLTYEEISQATGKSVASCKMRFARTMKRLRNDLALLGVIIIGIILSAKQGWL